VPEAVPVGDDLGPAGRDRGVPGRDEQLQAGARGQDGDDDGAEPRESRAGVAREPEAQQE
jgi:hypothetical protein